MTDALPNAPDPIVTFYRAIPESFEPMRADRSALGVIPTAAFQYCEALTSASAFGWYLFSPMTFYLRSEEHTSELQSLTNLVCRLLLEKKKKKNLIQPNRHDMTI